jgi:ABC-type glutathione transport system ATPase component
MDPEQRSKADGPLLSVRDLTLHYSRLDLLSSSREKVTALSNVSLDLFAGKVSALTGKSGSGKSSLARCLVLLERPEGGQILYRGKNLLSVNGAERRTLLREIAIVFQDAAAAMNPSFTIEDVLAEPLLIQQPELIESGRNKRIREALAQMELSEKLLLQRPLELSGGQRQRVGIARAVVQNPRVLILDEALSALDLSTQNQIANILLALKREWDLSVLLITHDLELAEVLGDERLEMAEGRVQHSSASNLPLTANQQNGAIALPGNSVAGETVEESETPWPTNRC